MNRLILLFVPFLLSGCALLSPRFDNNEYQLLVQFAVQVNEVHSACDSNDAVKKLLPRLRTTAEILDLYTANIPRDSDVHNTTKILLNDVKEMQSFYNKGTNKDYCSIKTELLLEKTAAILKAVGQEIRQ